MAEHNEFGSRGGSIYNYPEHLNPFYKDENHKRLRFWKIGTNNLTRRSSFSLSGIKEFLPLKSFRLRKRSSALGINKTSESPPMIRKHVDAEDESKYNTYDPHFRHTTSVGLNSNFQRNAQYRSSMQDMNGNNQSKDGDLGFFRNNRYRSTIQNSSYHQVAPQKENRYVYAGSVTPTPKSRYHINRGMTPGSSQTSIVSSNPFDDDEDREDADTMTIASYMTQSGVKHHRKKRRAPQPPTNVPKISTSTENGSEVGAAMTQNGGEDFSRLTAEIETFVHTHEGTTVDNIELKILEEPKSKMEDTALLVSGSKDSKETKQVETLEKKVKIVDVVKKSPVKELTREKTISREPTPDYIPVVVHEKFHVLRIDENELETKMRKSPEKEEKVIEKIEESEDIRISLESIQSNKCVTIQGHVEVHHSPERDLYDSNKIEKVQQGTPQEVIDIQSTKNNLEKLNNDSVKTQSSLENEKIKLELEKPKTPEKPQEKEKTFEIASLKFRQESPKPKARERTSSIPKTEVESTLEHQGFKKVDKPLTQIPNDETIELRIKLEELEDGPDTPKVVERRRSVKEIIESINKSQSLLKMNHPPTPQMERKSYLKYNYLDGPINSDPVLVQENQKDLSESERKIKELLSEMEDYQTTSQDFDLIFGKTPNIQQARRNSFYDNIPDVVQRCDEMNNSVTFEKCVPNERRSGEYNPLPKPRRSRIFENTTAPTN